MIMAEKTAKLAVKKAPQMPIIATPSEPTWEPLPAALPGCETSKPQHHENISVAGYVSHEWFAMVHKPIPIPEAIRIPRARQALQEGWDKLHAACWNRKEVFERKAIEKLYRDAGKRHISVRSVPYATKSMQNFNECQMEESIKVVLFSGGTSLEMKRDITQYFQNKDHQRRT